MLQIAARRAMVMSAEILGRKLLVTLLYPISRRAALPDAWFLLIVWQFGAGERTGLPLHGDVDGVPAAAVLAHAVQGVAIAHERDQIGRASCREGGARAGVGGVVNETARGTDESAHGQVA